MVCICKVVIMPASEQPHIAATSQIGIPLTKQKFLVQIHNRYPLHGGTISIDATVDLELRLTDGRCLGASGEFGSQLAVVVGGSVLVV